MQQRINSTLRKLLIAVQDQTLCRSGFFQADLGYFVVVPPVGKSPYFFQYFGAFIARLTQTQATAKLSEPDAQVCYVFGCH